MIITLCYKIIIDSDYQSAVVIILEHLEQMVGIKQLTKYYSIKKTAYIIIIL